MGESGDGFNLGVDEFAAPYSEVELGAVFGFTGFADRDDTVKREVFSDQGEPDFRSEDDTVAGLEFFSPFGQFFLPFAGTGVLGGRVEVELTLIEVHRGDGKAVLEARQFWIRPKSEKDKTKTKKHAWHFFAIRAPVKGRSKPNAPRHCRRSFNPRPREGAIREGGLVWDGEKFQSAPP